MKYLIPALLALASCDDGDVFHVPQDPAQASSWEIGPMVRGENRSPRAERVEVPGALVAVEIPHGVVGDKVGELSGLTFVHGSLEGKTRIRVRFRIEAAPDVRIVNSQDAGAACINLFFQRRGDNWSAVGEYEDDRWYAGWSHVTPVLVNQTYEMDVSLDDPQWGATTNSTAASNPTGFADAKANAERVGLVFGGGDGHAHGLYATGRAVFILEAFEVL